MQDGLPGSPALCRCSWRGSTFPQAPWSRTGSCGKIVPKDFGCLTLQEGRPIWLPAGESLLLVTESLGVGLGDIPGHPVTNSGI